MSGAPSEDNCHPWMFDKLMWMHNGEINDFPKIKRALQQSLPDELFLYPSGYTGESLAICSESSASLHMMTRLRMGVHGVPLQSKFYADTDFDNLTIFAS